MNLPPSAFWNWFREFASRLLVDPDPESLLDELLWQLQSFDDRLYFLVSINATPYELIITADGNEAAFASADTLVAAAPELPGWVIHSLKPAKGFSFRHTDGLISLDVSQLWFLPTRSANHPGALGIVLGLPDADFVLEHQSVDTAYTILESAIGERICARDIARVAVDDLPDSPAENGYLELPRLPEFIAFHKRQHHLE